MSFSLRELQLLTEREYSIEETRQDLNRLVDWFCSQPEQEHYLKVAVQNTRKLPVEIAKQQKVFFVNDEMTADWLPEEFRVESMGFVKNKHVVFAGRLVYPVMDVKGNVMGFCGWDKFYLPKYLDSKNQGYKAKQNNFYGMECLPEYYRNDKPVYVVEGIVCCLYLRSKGFQAFATLGSHLTPYTIEIFKRFGNRLICIPDNDTIGKLITVINQVHSAGDNFVKQIKRELPKARVFQSTIAKDIDDTRLYNNGEFEEKFIAELKQVGINPFVRLETLRLR